MPIPRYKIFSPTDAARVSKLQLTARQVVEGVITGLHKSPHRGFSVEFSEHREYVAGLLGKEDVVVQVRELVKQLSAEGKGVEGIDPKRPYLQRLPSGKSIAIFFYDGPVARAVAFEGLLADGERFRTAAQSLGPRYRGSAAEVAPSGRILARMKQEKRTFWHSPSASGPLPNQHSLVDVHPNDRSPGP